MRNYLFATIFLLTCAKSFFAQDNLDSFPFKNYEKKAENLLDFDYDNACSLIDTLEFMANKHENRYYQGVSLYLKGKVCSINTRFDSAFFYVKEAQEILKDYSDSSSFYKVIRLRGNLYMETGDHFQALREYKKCIQLLDQKSEKDGDYSNPEVITLRAHCFSKIGIVYGEIGDFKAEKENLERSMHIAVSLRTPEMKRIELYNSISLAYSYYRSGNLDLAERLALENLSAKEAYGYKYSLGQNYQILGLIEMKRKNFKLALEYLDKSDEKIKPFKITKEIVRNKYYRAQCYSGMGKNGKALALLEEIDKSVNMFFSQFELSEYNYQLSLLYENDGEYIKAIQALDASNQQLDRDTKSNSYVFLDDFIQTIESSGVDGMDSEVQVRLGSIQSQMAKEKIQLQYDYQKQKKSWIYGVLTILIIGLIIILALIFYAYQKNKQKMESLRLLSDEKRVLFQEVHHRVKNNFQVISSMLNLQANFSSENESNALLESKLRIQSMALVHNLIYRDEEIRNISIEEYTSQLFEIISEAGLNNNCAISLVKDFDDIRPTLDEAVPLGLIFNELFSVFFLRAFNDVAIGTIKISFKNDPELKGNYVIAISHDGDQTVLNEVNIGDQSSLTIGLIEALSEQLSAETLFDRNGTVTIKLKLNCD